MLDQEIKIFILGNPQLSITEMYEALGKRCTKEQIRNCCKNNNATFRRATEKEKSLAIKKGVVGSVRKQYTGTKINHDYFKTWSSNMAYIFGLWCADGNIYHSKENHVWRFEIRLKTDDSYLLQEILTEIGSEHRIYKRVADNSSCIGICCKTIYKDIVNLGGKEKKSLTLTFPNVPEDYRPDFIRGYFDGDGCVHPSQKKRLLTWNKGILRELSSNTP